MTHQPYEEHRSLSAKQQTDIVVETTTVLDANKQDKADIEAQFLLQEFNALRAEILARQGFQLQYMNIAILLLGGVLAAFPLIIVSSSGALKIPLPYLTLALLVLSLIFAGLLWATTDSDIEQANLGMYIHQITRSRAATLLSMSDDQEVPILEWEAFRSRSTQARSITQIPQYIVFVMRSTSRYLLFLLPAVFALVMAGILFFGANEFLFIDPMRWLTFTDPMGWLTFTLFIVDLLYLLALVPVAFYIATLYGSIAPQGGSSATKKR